MAEVPDTAEYASGKKTAWLIREAKEYDTVQEQAEECSYFYTRVLGVSPNKSTLHFGKNVGQSAYLAKRKWELMREKREKKRVLGEKRKGFKRKVQYW